MLKRLHYANYLLHLYIIMDELVEQGEYNYIKTVILIGGKPEAFLLNLLLKKKGIKVFYMEESCFLEENRTINRHTKYFILPHCKKAIDKMKAKDAFIGRYIIAPISKER